MSIFGPIVILIPVLAAFYFCEWQVVVAFIVAVLVLPSTIFILSHLYEVIFLQKPMNLKSLLEMGTLFSVAGVLIYFILILPIYYALKSTNIPILYSFPASVSIIIFLLFIIMTTKPWGYKEFLVVVGCSLAHSFFIIWLISRLKSIS